jgi:hypothetical protein
MRLLLLALVLLAASPAGAQIRLNWHPDDELNALLPSTIRAFSVDTTVQRGGGSGAIRAFLIVADTTGADWTMQGLLEPGGAVTTSTFALDSDAYVAINAGYFGGGQSFSLVANEGEVLVPNIGALSRPAGTYFPTRGAFGLLEGGSLDVAWIYNIGGTQYAYPSPTANTEQTAAPQPTATFPEGAQVWPIEAGVGGGPVLVESGQVRVTWEEEVFFGSGIGAPTDLQPRTAAGYTAGGEILLMVVDGRQPQSAGISLVELAQVFVDLGAVEALNLDGGGSSTMVVANRLVNRPGGGTSQRPVASALVLARAEEDTGVGGGPVDGVFFYDADPEADHYRESGEWFASANTPFYGSAPGRLTAAGGEAGRATFVLEGLEAGRYELDAWWVASFNRATNTPFVVFRGGTSDTVRVDQADPGTLNTWQRIGTYDLAPGDSVVVIDAASGTTNPSYVMADGLRLTPVASTSAAPPGAALARTLRAFPSPSAGQVTIARTDAPARAQGAVYDVLGREQVRFTMAPGQTQLALDLTGLPAGLYLVRTTNGSDVQTATVVLGSSVR